MTISKKAINPFGMAVAIPKKSSDLLVGKVIVQILPALNHGGVERGTAEMAEAIVRAGGKAVVISNGGHMENRLRRSGVEHITLPVHSKNPLKWMFIRRKVKAALVAVDADIVHIRSRAPAWIAMSAARSLGLNVVTTVHGRFKASSLFKKLYNSIMVKSDRIIAISSYIESLISSQFPDVEDKIKIIHRGVDIDQFNPMAVPPQRVINMSEKLMIPDGVPVVMLPSRPTSWKGMSVLIEAMSLLQDLPFLLVLVGAGDGADETQKNLIRQIEKAGLTSKARLNKSIDDMPAAMMIADVVAMPSVTPEPFGRVVVEGSAMGCPVVAFRHGGAIETIVDGETGWLADPIDPVSLSEAIRKALMLNQQSRQKLSKKARAHIEANFSSDKMCASTIEVYMDLLSEK